MQDPSKFKVVIVPTTATNKEEKRNTMMHGFQSKL